jgi:hypothetical protein
MIKPPEPQLEPLVWFRTEQPVLSMNAFSERNPLQRHKERETWQWVIRGLLGKPKKPFDHKVQIRITRFLGPKQKFFDEGAMHGGSVKQIVDALKLEGWLVDDSRKWVTLECLEDDRDRKKPGTLLQIFQC